MGQVDQSLIATQDRVDILVIDYVIAVAGKRSEDRVEIKCIDPEVSQVAQLPLDALQVAAVERPNPAFFWHGLTPRKGLANEAAERLPLTVRVVARVSITKSVRVDLVKHTPSQPRHL